MSYSPFPKSPKTYTAYRAILLAVFAVGLFLFGLVLLFPGIVAIGTGVVDIFRSMHDSYDWEPF
jgi:hypothetical protein